MSCKQLLLKLLVILLHLHATIEYDSREDKLFDIP